MFLRVYKTVLHAMAAHEDARVLVNFASLRVAYDVSVEAMSVDEAGETTAQIRCITIIAEGIPENLTRQLIARAKERGVLLIGPATVSHSTMDC